MLQPRRVFTKKYFKLILCLLLLIGIPYGIVLCSVSNVGSFLKSEKVVASHETNQLESPSASVQNQNTGQIAAYRHKAGGLNIKKSLKTLKETAISSNPLLFVFAIPGLLLLTPGSRRIWTAITIWLLIIGTILVPIKPQLELDRMLVVMKLILCGPVALALAKLFDVQQPLHRRVLPALSFGFLITGPFCTAALLLNRTPEQYQFAEPVVQEISQAIKDYGGSGRVLFSGFVLHELSNGHLAPLTVMTGKPLVASSQFHNMWRYTQVVPASFMKRGDAGIEEYFDLFNVSAVFAHEKSWREYFQTKPTQYEQVWKGGRFIMFKRLAFKNSWFQEGSGSLLEQSDNFIKLKVDSQEAVIKFNYFPFLKSSSCNISQAQLAPEVKFVRLQGCEVGAEVVIKSMPPWRRILNELHAGWDK